MSEQIQASHILLMYEGSLRSTATRSQENAKQKISEIKEDLNGGMAFKDAAKQHSDCPSAAQGGDLGSFGKGMMVPEFEEVAFTLEIGSTSDVIETDFGYHLIMRTG